MAPSSREECEIAAPRPAALMESLRSVGYSLPTAIADIVDNSITASAQNVWLTFQWAGGQSTVSILDDGRGMALNELVDAMRPGSSSPNTQRSARDLGRFGLGLKTATFSQCRKLSVVTRCSGGVLAGRKWDIDFVTKRNEWRLLPAEIPPDFEPFQRISGFDSGTLVFWELLDRLSVEGDSSQRDPHERFLQRIKETQRYLEMIFHRYLAGPVQGRIKALNIFVNGTRLKPWDPFHVSGKVMSEMSPDESIGYMGSIAKVRGYVLPHKDQLTEEEFSAGGGLAGWNALQGFYVYRNDRMLLAGDWLGLGTGVRPWQKEEQYRLARLSIDIGNSRDFDWSLDVKKSSARPPPELVDRLTGLAERQRKRAKEVFVHRGAYGPRPEGNERESEIDRAWTTGVRGGLVTYKVNRSHPVLVGLLRRVGPLAAEVELALRLIEESVPVERIWIDHAESDGGHATPYEGISDASLKADLRKTYDLLKSTGMPPPAIKGVLLTSEPFSRFPVLIAEISS